MRQRILYGVLLCGLCLATGCARQRPAMPLAASGGRTATAVGIVAGLRGTGDGPDFRPLATIRPESDRRTMALVFLHAEIPLGARSGQHVWVHVSPVGPATSLENGRLVSVVLTSHEVVPQTHIECSGNVSVDRQNATSGKARGIVRVRAPGDPERQKEGS